MGSEHWARKPELLEGLLFGQADIDQFRTIYNDNVPISIELWDDDSGGDNCQYNNRAGTTSRHSRPTCGARTGSYPR
jgi:hypothetical protein